MKKILLFLLISIFALSIFADIYEVIPQNSKAVIVMNNAKTVYNDLKTVPVFGKILDDPTYAESLISGMIDAYIQSLEMNSDEVYSALEKNVGLFIIEPTDNKYDFGIVLGPVDDGNKYVDIFSKVINALMPEDAGITFDYIVKKSDLQDYLIITTNKKDYENSQLKFVPQKRFNDTGIYEEVNTSSLKGYGFSNVKDGYLYSTFNLFTDNKITPSQVNVDNSDFYGLLFSRTNYLPKDLSINLSSFGITLPEDLINNILNESNWAEETSLINLKMDDETGNMSADMALKIMINTKSSFEEIEKLIPSDASIEKLGSNYIKVTHTVENNTVSFYLWKDSDILYISNVDKNKINEYNKKAIKLSQNKLYTELKSKVPESNIGLIFFDLKPLINFLKDYLGVEGLDGEFGGLATSVYSKSPEGKNMIEFHFVMK
ncbi:hypothetical protein [Marinitoga aeolica]|uniref:DUF3352 domain-containing protein n=1 Tax=Marinitoga aeolica TaxID=2809031 RepID=A0ABY8PT16_9BACT|nr:hypothetical protein [Marinitoga aeolica]WGS65781.1 hypothetical protein JRV97_04310 [Marinitoga aeolica]